jgi:hypothetical protein
VNLAATCPACGGDLASAGAPCPSCESQGGDVETLLARALDELRTLPAEKVRQVLDAVTALADAVTLRVTLSGTVSGGLAVDTATVVDSASGKVVGAELPPATVSLLKLVTKENVLLAAALASLMHNCVGLLRERARPQTVNVTVALPAPPPTPPAPPSAPKAPEGSEPGAPKAGEPPPLLKRP